MPKRKRSSGGGPNVKKKKVEILEKKAVKRDDLTRKRRPRTAGIRKELATQIEIALKTSAHPSGSLFSQINQNGVPYASLSKVISTLDLNEHQILRIGTISEVAMLKMNNLTTIFAIEKDRESGEMLVVYTPIETPIDCTFYLDNLPVDCNRDKLMKLLRKFGNVVEIAMPFRRVSVSDQGIRGRGHLGFAFAQFTEKESTDRLLRLNSPGKVTPKTLTMIKLWRKMRRWRTVRRHHNGRLTKAQRKYFKPIRQQYKRFRSKHLRLQRSQLGFKNEKKQSTNGKVSATKKKKRRRVTDWPTLRKLRRERRFKRRQKHRRRVTVIKAKRAIALISGKTAPKRVRFRRRQRNRANKPDYIHCSIDEYFEKTQAISFKEYMRLREEYFMAQKQRQEAKNEQIDHQMKMTVEEFRDKSFKI